MRVNLRLISREAVRLGLDGHVCELLLGLAPIDALQAGHRDAPRGSYGVGSCAVCMMARL